MEHDSLIFDMDGTLVDWSGPISVAWTQIFNKYGWGGNFTKEDFKAVAGHTTAEIGALIFPDVDNAESERRVATASREEVEYILSLAKWEDAFFESRELFEKLSSKYRLFIVSNCMAGYIEAFIKVYGLDGCFEDYRDHRNGKPKWGNIEELVKVHDLKAPLYIGDTIMDFEACQKAGVDFLFAAYGYGSVRDVPSINALGELLSFKI